MKQIQVVDDVAARYVDQWKAQTGVPAAAVLVRCADASTRSGLFCACYIVCEKMALDNHVSVFHAVKSLRLRQPGLVASLVNNANLF